ncbi:hypothetical protein BHM04_08105 [Macrococcus sp. IME1552]|nr:hypothetical protein [Macrococcus sp. IME1552]ATD31153.1 hypothetical protein BHM04_08105 [Macrococcus sp. IME1552]
MGIIIEQPIVFNVEQKYDSIYQFFNRKQENKNYIFENGQLFLICVSIGYRNSNKVPLNKKGTTQTRGNVYKRDEENLLLNIIYSEFKDFDKITKYENRIEIKKLIEEYANGGMEILLDKVLNDYWDGEKLDDTFSEYHYIISKFILSEIINIPF